MKLTNTLKIVLLFTLAISGYITLCYSQQLSTEVSNEKAVRIDMASFGYRGVGYSMKRTLDDGYYIDLGCRIDTGAVDIVFIIDSTGSMAEEISDIRSNVDAFAAELDSRGYDYRFGGVTFGDGANTWDFNTGSPGYQMTADYLSFRAKLFNVGAWGGADVPEQALDAFESAINNYYWRPDAVHILIFFTDACFCQIDECGDQCWSSFNEGTVYNDIVAGGYVVYAATRSPVACEPCASIGMAGATAWYQNTASESGGQWYTLGTPWSVIFNDVIALIDTFATINFCVTNTSGSTINPGVATIFPGSCISILDENPQSYGPWLFGEEHCFSWRIDVVEGCTGPDACFQVTISGGGHSDTAAGCVFLEDCACPGPEAAAICPPRCTEITPITACPNQQIAIAIEDDDSDVNPSTITLMVNGTPYYYPLNMTFSDGILTWTPPSEWTHRQTVDYQLLSAEDINGCPLMNELNCNFVVDIEPPEIVSYSPADGYELPDTILTATVELNDDVAGIDVMAIYFTLNGNVFTLSSPYVLYTGDVASGTAQISGGLGRLGITDAESIEICIYVQDLVPESDGGCALCGPNDTIFCWNVLSPHRFGPVAQIISPQPDQTTSCRNQCIQLTITDDDTDIDATTILFAVLTAGINDTFSVADPQLTWTAGTLSFCPDTETGFWANDAPVYVSIISADDLLGNPLSNPTEWSFWVDLEPPQTTNFAPPCGTIIHSSSPDISFNISDNLSGVDESALIITFNDAETLLSSDAGVSITDGNVLVNTGIVGLHWSGGDTIDMCVSIQDSPDLCAPNETTYCCQYFIATEGPYPGIIRPFNGAWSSCDDEYISFFLSDDEGIVASTIIFTVERSSNPGHLLPLTTDSAGVMLTGDSTYYFVEYHPSVAFADGETIYVCVENCSDYLGNPMSPRPLCWRFCIDRSPPHISDASPAELEIISDHTPAITFSLVDDGTAVDISSIVFTVNGVEYPLSISGDAYSWNAEDFSIEFEGGDTVRYCIHAEDTTDYCADNALDTCISFVIQMGPSIDSVWFYEETDCDGQNVVQICYILSGDTADVAVLMSSDGGSTWDVPLTTLIDTSANIGLAIVPGTHCFGWVLSEDLPNVEGNDFIVKLSASIAGTDSIVSLLTFSGALDSRSPDVYISCPTVITAGESWTFSWSSDDMFPSSVPCSLHFSGCGIDETYLVSGNFFLWTAPDIECDECTLTIAVADSFCNWGHNLCAFFIDVPPAIDSVWFYEETDCDDSNIVSICYSLIGDTADISFQMSSDGGISWDVPIATLLDTSENLGSDIAPGLHCFRWLMSDDLPNVEGCDFVAEITASSGSGLTSDTSTISCLDSRHPDVKLNCPDDETLSTGDTIHLSWTIDELFPGDAPFRIRINYCSSGTTITTTMLEYDWVIPWTALCCDSIHFIISATDSFCNIGMDSCFVIKSIGGTITRDTFLCLGDTLTLCCSTYTTAPLTIWRTVSDITPHGKSELLTTDDDSCCYDFIPLTPGEDLICHTVYDSSAGCEYEECIYVTTCCRPEGVIEQNIITVDSIFGTYTTLYELEFNMFDFDTCYPCCDYDELNWFILWSSDSNWPAGPLTGYHNDTIIYINVSCEESIKICVDAVNDCGDAVPCVAETCVVLYGDSCHPCCELHIEPDDTIVCETEPEIDICVHINDICALWEDYDTLWWDSAGVAISTGAFLDDTCITVAPTESTEYCAFGIANSDTCFACITIMVQHLPETLRDTTVYLGQTLIVYYPGSSDSSILFTHPSDSVGSFRLCYTVDLPPCEPYEDCMIVNVIPPEAYCPLRSGWNQIGFNVEPRDTALREAFLSIWENLEQVIGESGTYIRDLFSDLYGVHGGRGYWVRMSDTDNLSIVGDVIPSDTPIPLSSGWHSIGYLLDEPLPPEDALASIDGKYDQIWGEDGIWIVGGLGDLDEMKPCKGYDIHITEPCTLNYSQHTGNLPETAEGYDECGQCFIMEPSLLDTTVGPYTFVRTPASCFYFGSAYIEGTPVQPGDVVAVFKDTICCGANFISDTGSYSVRAYGAVAPDPGFSYGEVPQFRIWRTDDETEFIATAMADSAEIFWENLNYHNVDIVAPSAVNESEFQKRISLSAIPNPFNSSISIVYFLPQPANISLDVYDLSGHRVCIILKQYQSSGVHYVLWTAKDEIASGVYFIRLATDKNKILKRVVLIR